MLESASCQSSGKARQLYNPATGAAYDNNFINPLTFNTPALNLLKSLPVSTDPCEKITYAIPNPNNENQHVGRVDWVQSQKNSIFGRYFIDDYSNPAFYNGNLLTTTRSALVQRAQSVVLGDQYSFGPFFINSVHVGFVRLAVNRKQPAGMPSPTTLGVNMYNATNDFTDPAVSNHFSVGGGSNAPASFIRNQWQIADDIDWIRGRHHLSIGAEYIVGQMDENNLQFANGEFSFNGSRTISSSNSQSGDALADFMLGAVNTVIDSNIARVDLRQKYIGAYVEDSYQLSKRLNVHAGSGWSFISLLRHFDWRAWHRVHGV